MKRILCAILAAVILTALFTACGKDASKKTTEKEPERYHTLYYRDSAKSDTAVATFFNSNSGESVDIEMVKIGEDDDGVTFSCEGDCAAYNMAYVTCGDRPVTVFSKFAFNHCTGGWYQTDDELLPYTRGTEPDYYPACDETVFDCKGYQKSVRVWVPDDYDPLSKEPYATVYVLDGQYMVPEKDSEVANHQFAVVVEQVKAMSANTGYKAIVVAIDSDVARDYEMVPEIGDSFDEKMFREHNGEELSDQYDSMNGTEFATFVAETLVPYVRQHYNVYEDALHTSVTGYSLGGLEAFYLSEEYPDLFGTVGALSPSFWKYDDATWNAYLEQKSVDDNAPFIYLYTGPGGRGKDTDPDVTNMYHRLIKLGYPAEKLALHYNEEGLHDARFWRGVFSEFLEAMVYQHIEPLQK